MDKAVLTYNYGMQLNTGVEEKYERGCYIHPLWDVNGWQRTITEDFPPLDGHLHHRGLGWTWPSVKVRGLKVQTWHPSDPPLRQHFVRWLRREAGKDRATVAVENAWLLNEKSYGTIDALYNHWLLGGAMKRDKLPRWSILKNVLKW